MKPIRVHGLQIPTHIARVLSPKGIYPALTTGFSEGLYVADENLCFCLVTHTEPYEEDLYSEVQWLEISEIRLLIADFTNSYNFARTHSVVAKLSKYTDFTAAQVNAIVSAAVNNSQIRSIIDDPDVWEFLASVVRGREDLVDEENLEIFRELLAPPKPVLLDDADVPF